MSPHSTYNPHTTSQARLGVLGRLKELLQLRHLLLPEALGEVAGQPRLAKGAEPKARRSLPSARRFGEAFSSRGSRTSRASGPVGDTWAFSRSGMLGLPERRGPKASKHDQGRERPPKKDAVSPPSKKTWTPAKRLVSFPFKRHLEWHPKLSTPTQTKAPLATQLADFGVLLDRGGSLIL